MATVRRWGVTLMQVTDRSRWRQVASIRGLAEIDRLGEARHGNPSSVLPREARVGQIKVPTTKPTAMIQAPGAYHPTSTDPEGRDNERSVAEVVAAL